MKWKLVGGAMVWVLHLISFQSHGQESEKTTTSHAVTNKGNPNTGLISKITIMSTRMHPKAEM
ncbi:MAG TPA: hypothetical protein PK803_04255 [Alphaproteobacteria bacterium]|nr:hypothetical protein [Alphaproteobacteria bacterium]